MRAINSSGEGRSGFYVSVPLILLVSLSAYAVGDAFLVKDIQSGTGSSNPTGLSVLGSNVYFSAAASGTNTELWMSDGTNAGTVLVKEIQAGATGSAPSNFASAGSYLFFVANDGTNGAEPYVSTGAVGNASLLKDIAAGATGSSVSNQTVAGGNVYFTANDGSTGVELYVTNGTVAGTVLTKDIRTGAGNSSSPTLLTAYGSSVIFEATDGSSGVEPYVSDGTSAGTLRLADIQSGVNGSTPVAFKYVPALGLVFFDADSGTTATGRELYKTNGTTAGTSLVRDIRSGTASSSPTNFAAIGSRLYFAANNGTNGNEPWTSDGTSGGTTLLLDVNSGAGNSDPTEFVQVGSNVFFAATGAGGRELWMTDGTSGGTARVKNIRPGNNDSNPVNLTAFGNLLFFACDDGSGVEPYISDGTSAGTFQLANVGAGNASSTPQNIIVTSKYVYFTADDGGTTGREWWRTDGTTAGTSRVYDIGTGATGSAVSGPVSTGEFILFNANNGTAAGQFGAELWGIDYIVPTVSSVVRAGSDPTNASTVTFTVTFSEGVTGVGTADFLLTTAGVTGASIAGVSQVTTSTYTVTVNTGTGSGTIRLDVLDDDTIQDLKGSANPLGGIGSGNGSYSSGETYTIDKTAPAVSSITLGGASPTNAASVTFNVTFSKSVTGVDSSDFALTTTGVTGASVSGVTQNTGNTYTVTVNTGSGSGTIRLDVADDDTIQDSLGNRLGGTGAGNGNFTSGSTYTIDKTAPAVSSISRASADPTAAASVNYTVTFSESVTGVNTTDFTVTTTGTISGASVTSVTPVSGTVYTVAVSTGTGSGTLRLDLADDDSIVDTASNPLGGTGTGNGNFTTGQSYTVDRTSPSVSSIVRVGASPTNAASVSFTVTFSEGVTGVNNADFTLTTTGVAGASVTSTTQVTTSTYTVVVNTGSGSGTIRLDVTDDDTIQDTLGNRLGGTGTGNGNFTSGQVYTIDKTGPTVLSIARAGTDPTNASSVPFTVTFSENVTGVDSADFTLTTTGVSGTSLGTITQVTPDVYTVNVNTGTGSGTIRLNFADNDSVIDAVGNPAGGAGAGNANFNTGQVYTIDRTGPTVSSINRLDANPTNAATVDFQVTFSENVTGVDAADFAITTTGSVSGTAVGTISPLSGTTYIVAVSTGAGAGTIRLDFTDNDSVVDSVGNPAGGAGAGNANFTTGQVYTIDRTGPTVVSIVRASGNPTNASSVNFTVTFDENVTGVNTADFTLNVAGVTGASVTSVTQVTASTYTVAVNTGTGSGVLRLDLVDDDSIQDTFGNVLGGTGANNGDFTAGEVYTVDRTDPVVLSIVRANSDPTNNATVNFTVTFSENVTGVNTADFTLTTTGVTGTSISSVTQVTPDVYTVAVNTGSGSGTIRLDLVDDDSIRDTVTNRLGGTGNGNGNFSAGEVYTIDKVVPTVTSINRAGTDPTGAASVPFTVTFSESVTGVDTSDFTLTTTGVSGASVASVVQVTQSTYTVNVNTGTGSGTIRLNVTDDDSIRDLATNRLGGTGIGNGNFTTGQTYTIDKTAPSVSSITRVNASPTNAASVQFLVTFSENVSGVDSSDFALTATGLSGTSITNTTQNTASTYTVTANTGSGDGTLRLDFADNDTVVDAVGNPTGGAGAGNGSFTAGQVYTVDRTSPTATITMPDANPTRSNKVNFTVTFSEDVGTSFDKTDVTVTGDLDIGGRTKVTVTGTGASYNVEVQIIGGALDAIIGISIGTDVYDLAGNPYGGGVSPGFYTVDNTPPTAVFTLTDPNPTNLDSVHFSVEFNESVGTTFGGGDVTITGTLATGATKSVSGSGSSYVVTITPSNPNANGTIGITLGTGIRDIAGNTFAGASSPTYTIDNTGPSVTSIVRASTNPTGASSVNYTVTFNESVTGVDTSDFTLTTSGVAGASVSSITPVTASSYTVTVNTGSGSGTLRLDLTDNDSITDLASNPLGGSGAGNGSFTTGEVYTLDKVVPTVVSIVRADADPTAAATVNFTVTFSEDVTGVNVADFALTTTGVTGASVTTRTQVTPSTYTITVNTGTGDGTIRLDLVDNDSIKDTALNPLGGTGNGNGNFTTGEVYTVDKTAPSVVSIVRAGTNPTGAATVQFTVTFSENVTGVNVGDFALTTTGVTGASITSRTQVTPNTYTITVDTGSGAGTIRLDLIDNDSIKDATNNPLGGVGNGNGNFTTGQVYTIDKTDPSVVSIVRVNPSPTIAASVDYTVTFSENVSGVDIGDFTLTTSGLTGTSIAGVLQNTASTYQVTVTTGTGSGTIRLDLIDDDSIADSASNPLGGAGSGNGNFTTGEVYVVDTSLPFVSSIVRAGPNPTNASSVDFTVTFSESVTGVGVGDFALNAFGVTGASITSRTQITQSVYTITVNTGSGSGTIRLDLIDNDSIKDVNNNPLGGPGLINGDFTSGEAYTIDRTPPGVASIIRANPNPTNASSVDFTVTFNENVTGVNVGDFALATTGGITGAAILSCTQVTPMMYTVNVNTGNGNGTIRLNLIDDDSVIDALAQPLGGPGIGNGNFTTGETYTVDKSATVVNAITRVSSNPTNAGQVVFQVRFTRNVTGVGSDDFGLDTVGIAGASVAGVTQLQGDRYEITVDTGSGDGTLKLLLVDDDSIIDSNNNPLGGAGAGNANYTTGETFNVDKTPPTIAIGAPSDTSTSYGPVSYTITYTGADGITLNPGMVTLVTTGTATGTVSVSGSGTTTRTVTISSIFGDGTIGIGIAAASAVDDASNEAPAAGPSATFDVHGIAGVPVNPWVVWVTMLLAAAAWLAIYRKRAV